MNLGSLKRKAEEPEADAVSDEARESKQDRREKQEHENAHEDKDGDQEEDEDESEDEDDVKENGQYSKRELANLEARVECEMIETCLVCKYKFRPFILAHAKFGSRFEAVRVQGEKCSKCFKSVCSWCATTRPVGPGCWGQACSECVRLEVNQKLELKLAKEGQDPRKCQTCSTPTDIPGAKVCFACVKFSPAECCRCKLVFSETECFLNGPQKRLFIREELSAFTLEQAHLRRVNDPETSWRIVDRSRYTDYTKEEEVKQNIESEKWEHLLSFQPEWKFNPVKGKSEVIQTGYYDQETLDKTDWHKEAPPWIFNYSIYDESNTKSNWDDMRRRRYDYSQWSAPTSEHMYMTMPTRIVPYCGACIFKHCPRFIGKHKPLAVTFDYLLPAAYNPNFRMQMALKTAHKLIGLPCPMPFSFELQLAL